MRRQLEVSNEVAAALSGSNDQILRALEGHVDCELFLRGNVITLDWTLDPNGFTEEENKVVNETKKILGDQSIGVCPTCVRVPVKVAHSEAITVEFHQPLSVADAKAALAKAPGVVFMDEVADGKFPVARTRTKWTSRITVGTGTDSSFASTS